MSKELKFICAQPDDTYYTWQVHAWIESLRELGHSDKAIVLIFIPSFREKNPKWQQIIDLYPEAEFHFYKDEKNEVSQKLGIYIPVLRPFCLRNYFTEHPEMKEKAVFYCDSDILFTDNFNLDKFKDDDIIYLSDTNSYINASYFDSKIKDVRPEKLEEYKKTDILAQLTFLIGIDRATCEENNDNSGGAQYFLKNVDGEFWNKVMYDCLTIRSFLRNVNQQFFKSEDAGFQSWCADMWAVLWNLWLRKQKTKVVPELEFAWASDPITKLDRVNIFHNAGVTGDHMFDCPVFYKGKYHLGADPFEDKEHLGDVLESAKTKNYCTYYYAKKLIELKNKYKLNY
jgi:hypothetical protein